MTSGDIRVGDVVEASFLVLEIEPGYGAWGRFAGSEERTWLGRKMLLAGRRIGRPLQVGDRVKCRGFPGCTILAIDGGCAWVKWPTSVTSPSTEALADLEPAPASEGGGT